MSASRETTLGPLQQAVLDFICTEPECSVRRMVEALNGAGHDYAYTTIQTVCDALHRKQLVSRRRSGSAFVYQARQSRAGLFALRLRELLQRVSAEPQPVASSLVDALETEAPEQLAALIAELKQRGKV
jgi:predicted transcriptional regulator